MAITLRATIALNAPIERLWPLLSDTDRVNRLVGLPPSERAEPEADLSRVIHGHYFGVPVTWREYPFEWVFEQWFAIRRVFDSPLPIKEIVTGTQLEALPDGRAKVEVWVDLAPRNIVGSLGARLVVGQKMLRDLLKVYRSFEALAVAAAQAPPPPRRAPAVDTRRMALASERLRRFGIRPALIDRLTAHLSSADDPDVVRMRPFALADAWGEPRLDVLRMFLYATRSGLLDLEWDVLCPNCRGPSVRTSSLDELERDAHCSSCNIRYDVNFDEQVELRFTVSPDIREAIDMPYCLGGPANTRHILAQLWLAPGSSRELRLRLPVGAYRLRSRQFPAWTAIEATAQAPATAARIRFAPDVVVAEPEELAVGPVDLAIENASGTSLLMVIEQSAWSAQAASAALVTALDEFRQLFSSQVLAPGMGVSVRNLTFLFSDLKDSTVIYDRIGDSPAYARVRDHFAVMRAAISRHHGALVKTIGDAVMAVFTSAEDAMAASLEIQREFTLGEIARGNPALRVKLGLHRGPCIAVNANDLLDYFGSTVNIAARVQNQSVGGDIVASAEVMDDPGVQRLLAQATPNVESFQCTLKGFSQTFTLSRIWVREREEVAEVAPQMAGRESPA